jgi:hypothetical protein
VVVNCKTGELTFSSCAGNCVGPSLSLSTELGVSLAGLGFLNGLETDSTLRALHALALECHACLSIAQKSTQTKLQNRETTREGREKQGQTNTRKGDKHKKGRRGCGTHFLNFNKQSGDVLQAALFCTLLIRFLWTNWVQNSQIKDIVDKIK